MDQQTPMTPMHHRMSTSLVITLIAVIIIIFLGVRFFHGKDRQMQEGTQDQWQYSQPTPGAGTTPAATQEEADSIRADLEASDVSGVSNSL